MTQLKINGIYDSRSVKFLKKMGVTNFGPDFRPRSFNFLQIHNLQSILEENWEESNNYFLSFDNEKNFVIDKVVESLNETVMSTYNRPFKNFYLELFNYKDIEQLEKVSYPFLWHYQSGLPLKRIFDMKNFAGIVFPHGLLSTLREKRQLHNFFNNLYHSMPTEKIDRIHFVLDLLWDDDPYYSMVELVDFSWVTVTISSNVERCYRNVDLGLLETEIKKTLQSPSIKNIY